MRGKTGDSYPQMSADFRRWGMGQDQQKETKETKKDGLTQSRRERDGRSADDADGDRRTG
jgi:hypothetical protein